MKVVFTALMFVVLSAGSAAAQTKFYGKEFKVGFTMPANSKLKKLGSDAMAPEKMKVVAHVDLITRDTWVRASATIAAGAMTEADCKVYRGRGNAETPRRQKFGTITFDEFAGLDGGMEIASEMRVYQTFHNGVCYEAELRVGTKYAKFDDDPVFNRLYVILRTFHFGN